MKIYNTSIEYNLADELHICKKKNLLLIQTIVSVLSITFLSILFIIWINL